MLHTQTSAHRGRRSAWLLMAAIVSTLALFGATRMPAMAAGLPVVTSIAPASGPLAGGNSVVITGSNLSGASDVKVDGASVPYSVTNSTQISIAAMPAHAAGTVDIAVVSSDDIPNTNTSADNYAYLNSPAVTSVSPGSGPGAGGTLVTLVGSGFAGATSVSFGGVAVFGLSVIDDGHIVLNAPAHAAGTVAVQVTTPAGTSAVVSAAQFTYEAVTAVTGVTPGSGVAGTGVTIFGSGFTGATMVTFGGTPSSFQVISDNIINAVSPAHAPGLVSIFVTSPTGTSAAVVAGQFTYTTGIGITSVSPVSGIVGITVTIQGFGFTGATSVTFGGSFAAFTEVSDTVITAVTPVHALGTVNVVVSKPGETSPVVAAGQFTYTANVPSISSISPSSGSSGTTVTIFGSGFTGATSVTFGGGFAAFNVVSDGVITAVSPSHSLGAFQVTVTTASGTSAFTSAANFTFRLNFCPGVPLWVDDLAYGSAGGGFYWDSVSGQVWTAQRGWHLFSSAALRVFIEPFWVDALTYGSAGGGFYWDSVSGQVWTAQRGWHLYSAQNCI